MRRRCRMVFDPASQPRQLRRRERGGRPAEAIAAPSRSAGGPRDLGRKTRGNTECERAAVEHRRVRQRSRRPTQPIPRQRAAWREQAARNCSMPEHTAAHQTPVAKELERRLRRRARRASILRRRVGALTISLFLVSWGAIYGGATSAWPAPRLCASPRPRPAARARRSTPVRRAGHRVERGVRSSGSSGRAIRQRRAGHRVVVSEWQRHEQRQLRDEHSRA